MSSLTFVMLPLPAMRLICPLLFFLFPVVFISGLTSCKKDNLFSGGNLSFSTDTLVFDTVFTSIGSTTQQFRIYNTENKTIKIESVELVGGSDSPFRLNLDGIQGLSFSDIELESGDSLYCFVEVTLDVNGGTLPLIVEDSIRFRTNGKDQYVKLAVWGQDAYFHYRDINEGTWPNDKPHVVYGYAGIDSAKTLTIQQNTQIFLHKQSMIYVFKGSLFINGTKDEPVVLRGDRLESMYDDVPGQYYGIYFHQALPSVIKHVDIKNGTAGIHVYSEDADNGTTPTVTVRYSEIWNNASYGIFLFGDETGKPNLLAENTIVHHNGVHAVLALLTAEFTFTHCDLLSYGGDGTTPAVGARNYYTKNGETSVGDFPTANFNNCVIYGLAEHELVFDTLDFGSPVLNFQFRNCDIAKPVSTNPMYSGCLFNQNPQFQNTQLEESNFRLRSTSPLIGAANPAFTLIDDFDETIRTAAPDIGAFEFP